MAVKNSRVAEEVHELRLLTKIESTSDLIRGAILKINDDIVKNKRER